MELSSSCLSEKSILMSIIVTKRKHKAHSALAVDDQSMNRNYKDCARKPFSKCKRTQRLPRWYHSSAWVPSNIRNMFYRKSTYGADGLIIIRSLSLLPFIARREILGKAKRKKELLIFLYPLLGFSHWAGYLGMLSNLNISLCHREWAQWSAWIKQKS